MNPPDEQIKRFINYRALPDITSNPEVWQIFKIRTVWKPDVFLPGRQTLKNRKKNLKENGFVL